MHSIELHPDVAAGQEARAITIHEGVLAPIPGESPAGSDIRARELWVELRKARPKPPDSFAGADPTSISGDWSEYRDALEQALCTTTKDLELALFLIEASARVHGFAGLRDGLSVLRGLITGFAHRGLHPRGEDGDLSEQCEKLHWLDEKIPDVIGEIPLTLRPEPATNYSLNYFRESRRQNGMITAAEFDGAADGGDAEAYGVLLRSIRGARDELLALKKTAKEVYGDNVSSFIGAVETLEHCNKVVESILRTHEAKDGGAPNNGMKEPWTGGPAPGARLMTTNGPGTPDAWRVCEQMARDGNIEGAISMMAELAASEANGRVRFHRKLVLADLCLKSQRKRLGTSILEELNEIIELHKLENWESSELIGGVWARLVRCYRDQAAGTGDPGRESEFFLKLSRLDPWQAVACGEPRRENA